MKPTVEDVRALSESVDPVFAESVARWDVRIGEDHWGDPGIFVTIVLKDSHAHKAWGSVRAFKNRLFEAILQLAPDYYPYIALSAESEALDPLKPVHA